MGFDQVDEEKSRFPLQRRDPARCSTRRPWMHTSLSDAYEAATSVFFSLRSFRIRRTPRAPRANRPRAVRPSVAGSGTAGWVIKSPSGSKAAPRKNMVSPFSCAVRASRGAGEAISREQKSAGPSRWRLRRPGRRFGPVQGLGYCLSEHRHRTPTQPWHSSRPTLLKPGVREDFRLSALRGGICGHLRASAGICGLLAVRVDPLPPPCVCVACFFAICFFDQRNTRIAGHCGSESW